MHMHARLLHSNYARVYVCVCVLARTCIRDAVVGRVVGIAKAPGHTSINTGLSLLVWVLSGQGVSPGKQLANRQSATWLSAARQDPLRSPFPSLHLRPLAPLVLSLSPALRRLTSFSICFQLANWTRSERAKSFFAMDLQNLDYRDNSINRPDLAAWDRTRVSRFPFRSLFREMYVLILSESIPILTFSRPMIPFGIIYIERKNI